MGDSIGERPGERVVDARLAACGWSAADRKALLYLLRWIGPGRVTALDAERVAFRDRNDRAFWWRRGWGLVAESS